MWEDFGSVEALCAGMQLTPTQVRIALAYRDAYPEEITEAIELNRRPLAEIKTLYPFIEVADRWRVRLLLDANLSPKRIGAALAEQGHEDATGMRVPSFGPLTQQRGEACRPQDERVREGLCCAW